MQKKKPAVSSPDQLLTGKLVRLGRLLTQSAAAAYRRKLALGQEEWRIIARVGSEESLSLTGLARRASLRKSQISRAAAALVNKGILSRTVGSEDARRAHLHLTPYGRRIRDSIIRTASERSRYLAQGMAAADQARLHRMLNRLLERAEELASREDPL